MLQRFGRSAVARARTAANKITSSVKWSQFKRALSSLATKIKTKDTQGLKNGVMGAAGTTAKKISDAQIDKLLGKYINRTVIEKNAKSALNYGISQLSRGSLLHPMQTVKSAASSAAKYGYGVTKYNVTTAVKSDLIKQAKEVVKKKLGK